jgi:hypothetical protein
MDDHAIELTSCCPFHQSLQCGAIAERARQSCVTEDVDECPSFVMHIVCDERSLCVETVTGLDLHFG